MRDSSAISLLCFVLLILGATALGQVGRQSRPAGSHTMTLNVVAVREGNLTDGAVTAAQLALYDNGVEQSIQSFSPDPGPARIVLLVDNSRTLRTDLRKLTQAAREFAYEIYEGDKLLIVGYDEQAEIIVDWSDDAKRIEAALPTFRKRGEPRLFDALSAVVDQALRPLAGGRNKGVIVIIGDGLDRGSRTKFGDVLAELQSLDIAVYALQLPDRTGGALRRDQPKPAEVIRQLTEGTGGRSFPFANPPKETAQAICDELRKNRYVLAYTPTSVPYGEARRLLIVASDGVNVRAKTAQPPR